VGCSGPVERLGSESSCTSERIRGKRPRSQAPVRLSKVLNQIRTHDTPRALSPVSGRLFESGLAVPDGRDVPSRLEAAACEPGRNLCRVPDPRSSRSTS